MKTLKHALLLCLFCFIANAFTTNKHTGVAKQDLTNSKWKLRYTNSDGENIAYEIYFNPKGRLGNTHPNDNTKDNDFWKQKGETVELSFNNKYVIYKGKLIDSITIVGQAKNEVGKKWKWKATKLE